jgi:two-component system, NtrC family, sensor kinase
MARILIVDDERSIRITCKAFLTNAGYDAEVAEDAFTALEMMKSENYDVVVTDIIMPKMSGVELLAAIREVTPHVQVIMMTGGPTIETASEALRLGAFDYLAKPATGTAIVKTVTNAVATKLLLDDKLRLETDNLNYQNNLERLVEERSVELSDSERKFKAIASTANDAIIMMDHKGNVSYWNQAAEALFGFSSDEISGKNLHSLLVPDRFISAHNKAFPEFIKTGKGSAIGKTVELAGIRKDGGEFPIELSLSGFQFEGNWQAVGIIRDISERKAFEVQLMQHQKMETVGTLAAGIAHEINTPTQFVGNNLRFLEDSFTDISAVLSSLGELLSVDINDNDFGNKLDELSKAVKEADTEFLVDEIPKAIEQSNTGIQNITRIVSAMRDFAHPGREDKSPADLHGIINNTITVSRNAWRYSADLETSFESDLPAVPCLTGELGQVILNLIINGVHAIEQVLKERKEQIEKSEDPEPLAGADLKGKITISTKRVAESVEIRISDTGGGIPDKIRDRVFEPFFTTKDVGKGTGQGLALAYNVIFVKHGGKITFETENNVGTTFVISLPLG